MIFDTTYRDKRKLLAIAEVCGEPYGFFEKMRMGGIGSQKFIVRSASPEIEEQVCQQFNLKHCNIELRKKGIVVRFGSFNRNFAWTIPYHHLNLVKNHAQLTIYSSSMFINVADAHGGQIDRTFLHKLLELKAEQVLRRYEDNGHRC